MVSEEENRDGERRRGGNLRKTGKFRGKTRFPATARGEFSRVIVKRKGEKTIKTSPFVAVVLNAYLQLFSFAIYVFVTIIETII